ncbi:50S ribosomal protein L23 [Candidatus Pacearchaeota archaeon CG10_big_fil_rev_8_21_14_0_10_32_42]|nr:MAG: 50S ribosomal protein L23 [Candidatus Pacearchaeota archaeon CG10_big_fil_rev_8_21_14_0_10_32_42]
MKKEKGMEGTTLKPIMTEKAVMMIEKDNTLIFQTSSKKEKKDLKIEIEDLFGVKVDKVRTLLRKNKKYVYIKLKGDVLAIDVATRMGLM